MQVRGAVWSVLLRVGLMATALCGCAPGPAAVDEVAQAGALEIARLSVNAPAEDVASGRWDARFRVREDGEPFIYERARSTSWWRVRPARPIAANAQPQLLLEGSYLARVEAWTPGSLRPTSHAIYGPDADPDYATRALVIGLPQGVPPGASVYLRVTAPAAVPIAVSLASREQVHRADLAYVAWRTSILTALAVLALLALAFWVGVGERTYFYLAATLVSGGLYLAGTGGEARGLPVLDALLGSSPQSLRVIGCLGTMASNHFMRLYLELHRHAPRLDRTLELLTIAMGVLAVCNVLVDASILAGVANVVLMLSSLAVLAAAVQTSVQGHRAAWFLLVSWLPLIVTCILKALQLSGFIVGAAWFTHALAASFALSGLILTIGLFHKLLQLRRDRDLASRQANTDGLTGLYNRAAVERGLREAVSTAHASGRPMCVAFIDIDHFKAINDNHGHHVGDCCLRFIALRVRNQLRKRDLLGRYGGDELLVVMPDTGFEDGLGRAERLRETVSCRPLSVDGVMVSGSLSIGLAALRRGETTEQLLERADAALYESKGMGRNQVSGENPSPLPRMAT